MTKHEMEEFLNKCINDIKDKNASLSFDVSIRNTKRFFKRKNGRPSTECCIDYFRCNVSKEKGWKSVENLPYYTMAFISLCALIVLSCFIGCDRENTTKTIEKVNHTVKFQVKTGA